MSELPPLPAYPNTDSMNQSPPRKKTIDAKVPGREVATCPGKCEITRAEFKKKYEEWKVSEGYKVGDFNYAHAWTKHVNNKKPNSKCVFPWEDYDAYDGKEEQKKPRRPRKSPDVCPGTCKWSRDEFVKRYTKHQVAKGVPLTDIKAGVSWANHTRSAAKGVVCDHAFATKPDASPKPVLKEMGLTDAAAVFLKRMDQHVTLLRGNLQSYEKKMKEFGDGMAFCDAEIDSREKKHQEEMANLRKRKKDLETDLQESETKKRKAEDTLNSVEKTLVDFATHVQTLTALTV